MMQGPTEAQMKGQFLTWLNSTEGERASWYHCRSALLAPVHSSMYTGSRCNTDSIHDIT